MGNSCGSGVVLSTLALLVSGIAANNVDDASTANDLAVLADSLDAGTNFHDYLHFNLYKGGKAPQYKRWGPALPRPDNKEFRSWPIET
jgi:hypothetical protein